MTGDAQRPVLLRLGRESVLERWIGKTLHQSVAECIYRYAENDVVVGDLSGKVWLREDATRRVRAPLNREEIVHAAIRCSVGIQYEPRLPNRTIRGDEGRDHICGAIRVRIRHLRIGRGGRTPNRRGYVTSRT
jgi:hypothetical protein